jgi:hypothetical protein
MGEPGQSTSKAPAASEGTNGPSLAASLQSYLRSWGTSTPMTRLAVLP